MQFVDRSCGAGTGTAEQASNRKVRRQPRRSARRARGALAWGLGAALSIQLFIALGVETWLPELRDPAYADKAARLRERTVSSPERPLTVVMIGSSRTVFGLRSKTLEQPVSEGVGRPAIVFNFGMYGAGPVVNLMNFRRLLAEGIRPDLLLIEVLPPLLTDKKSAAEVNRLRPEQLWWSDLKLLERYGDENGRLRKEWWLANLAPSYGHRYSIVSRVCAPYLSYRYRQDGFRDIDDSGWVEPPERRNPAAVRERALQGAREEYHSYLKDFRLGEVGGGAIREQLELCRREGISAGLVLMPEGTEFRSWYQAADWQAIEGFLTEVCQEYNVPVINAREWLPEEDFIDSHHMLPSGAERFTERLGREALVPLLLKRQGSRAAAGGR
jgi:hypothetical protein